MNQNYFSIFKVYFNVNKPSETPFGWSGYRINIFSQLPLRLNRIEDKINHNGVQYKKTVL